MRSLTVADIMGLHPCRDYPAERVAELWAGREALTLREISELDISVEDRLWVALAPGVLPDVVLGGLHCRIVGEAVEIYERYYPDDPRPRRANEIHHAMLRGVATAEEWAAAMAAARAATRAAARAAAMDAAWAAAMAATRAAARAAAMDAAWAAAMAATRDAAWDAARAATLARYLTWAIAASEAEE